ncbi:radical SAM protein [Rhizobium leguminosarum bv. trifolii]|uniref:Radical SAM protein n=1 Tax=Rhizobium leguminosarum bv. trifolii TaxID=386 RepID=A0A3E1B836_RHILT|nr:radical SAM protein [Rhizobium leguminosarum]RFB83099.1 radical SAM protein [Rhizobium leguminosarum bv. trifolii]RFB86371.1 radical SAM protein [Rhizobium leguminosarum bv. trifolii]RFB86629.1 radical SAM protein [Rhizobium leguminosarum bv. trifolii]
MTTQLSIGSDQFVAVRRDFVLTKDGDRPILYPLDYINTHIHFLTPIQGLALSLLDGASRFSEIEIFFHHLFPDAEAGTLAETLSSVDALVRATVSPAGIGAHGVLEIADAPITKAIRVDPRCFVIDPRAYSRVMEGVKTRFRLKAPINLYTVFTHRCQTDCLYCYADRRIKRGKEMHLARWRELIDEAAAMGVRMCSPDNGDTFVRPDGIDFLNLLVEHKMLFLLSTKAFLDRDAVERLVDAGFKEKINGVVERPVQLSFDAADEDLNSRLLNVKIPRTEMAARTFESFMVFGIQPIIKAVITGINVDQPKKIVDFFYPFGARTFSFVRYARSFHRHSDDLFVTGAHHATLANQFEAIRAEYPDIKVIENLSQAPAPTGELTPERKQEIWRQRIGCGGGWHALGIGPDGGAFLCEQMAYEERFLVGNARRQSLREIWTGSRLLNFIYPSRRQFSGSCCETCPSFERCMWEKGRCYRDAYFSYGSVHTTPPLCPSNDKQGVRLS